MLSKHFKKSEFECKCGCGGFIFNTALIILLEDVRSHFGSPVSISSSTRCTKHNDNEGGASGSLHLSGHAADITVKGVYAEAVYEYLNLCGYSDVIGLGSYEGFTHVDTRGKRARW